MRAQRVRRDAIGVTAEPIELIERPADMVTAASAPKSVGFPYKRTHLVALRASKISASDPPSTWWPGER